MFQVFSITADLGERLEEFKANPVKIDDKENNDGNVLETLDKE